MTSRAGRRCLMLLGARSAIAAFAIAVAEKARVPVAQTGGELQSDLQRRVRRLHSDTWLTAAAVAVMIDGQLAGAAVSGELRRDSGVAVTVDDRWHLGSITKSMTATLLAVLVDDGRLTGYETLTALLPDIEMDDGWGACTLHHLLTHTAGAPTNFTNDFQDVWPDTLEELVAERRRFAAAEFAGEPLIYILRRAARVLQRRLHDRRPHRRGPRRRAVRDPDSEPRVRSAGPDERGLRPAPGRASG